MRLQSCVFFVKVNESFRVPRLRGFQSPSFSGAGFGVRVCRNPSSPAKHETWASCAHRRKPRVPRGKRCLGEKPRERGTLNQFPYSTTIIKLPVSIWGRELTVALSLKEDYLLIYHLLVGFVKISQQVKLAPSKTQIIQVWGQPFQLDSRPHSPMFSGMSRPSRI